MQIYIALILIVVVFFPLSFELFFSFDYDQKKLLASIYLFGLIRLFDLKLKIAKGKIQLIVGGKREKIINFVDFKKSKVKLKDFSVITINSIDTFVNLTYDAEGIGCTAMIAQGVKACNRVLKTCFPIIETNNKIYVGYFESASASVTVKLSLNLFCVIIILLKSLVRK